MNEVDVEAIFDAIKDPENIIEAVSGLKEKGIAEIKNQFEKYDIPPETVDLFISICQGKRQKTNKIVNDILHKTLKIDKDLSSIL